jgi:two-component system phosphate regulon response regulator OmpR
LARVERAAPREDAGRRWAPAPEAGQKVRMGTCMLDLAAHRLYDAAARRSRLPVWSSISEGLRQHPDRVLSRDQLLAHNRRSDVFDRSIDVRITRIRKKIEIDPEKPQVLKTVRGAGYMFVQEGRKA